MTTVAVVIPFYQTRPGILARALRSVLSQDAGPGVRVRIVVVDDASPSPIQADLDLLGASDAARVEVIAQANGGPAAARNRGLDAAEGADFIAFLDSDDYWRPGHISGALAALGDTGDLFFADIDEGGGKTWFQRSDFGRGVLARGETARLPADQARSVILREHPAHASSVVYRRAPLAGLRFRAALRNAGEDHLFWIELARAARLVVVSPVASAGRHDDGVNMFTGGLDWDNPEMVKILVSVLAKYRLLENEPELAGPDLPLVRARRRASQDQLAFIILRQAAKRPASFGGSWARLTASEPGAAAWFLPAALRAFTARVRGRFEIEF